MPNSRMAPVDVARVHAVQPLHAKTEIRLCGLDEEMHVIWHEAEREEHPSMAFRDLGQQTDVVLVVLAIREDPQTIDAARDDVVPAGSELVPGLPGHTR